MGGGRGIGRLDDKHRHDGASLGVNQGLELGAANSLDPGAGRVERLALSDSVCHVSPLSNRLPDGS